MRSRPKVNALKVRSVSNWFENHPNAIKGEESEYIQRRKDLFSVVPRTISPLRQLLERSSRFRFSALWMKRVDDGGTIHYSSEQRIEFFISAVITIVGICLLIAPLWILSYVDSKVNRLVIITIFVTLILPLVTFTSNAKPLEALAATAAYVSLRSSGVPLTLCYRYAAVLVVFLQISG